MNLTPPPPSQNSHAVRWHCTAKSKRTVSEIIMIIIIIIVYYAEAARHSEKTSKIDIKSTAKNTPLNTQNTDTCYNLSLIHI